MEFQPYFHKIIRKHVKINKLKGKINTHIKKHPTLNQNKKRRTNNNNNSLQETSFLGL